MKVAILAAFLSYHQYTFGELELRRMLTAEGAEWD